MESLLHIGLSNTLVATGLAVVAAVVGAVTRRPALAHGLWLLVLLKLITPPFIHLPILPAVVLSESAEIPTLAADPAAEVAIPLTAEELLRLFPESQPADSVLQPVPEPGSVPESPSTVATWKEAWAILWLAGSAGWFLLAGYRIVRFRRLLSHAQPVPAELKVEIERLAERLGLRRCPMASFVPGSVSPMLWSIGGPPRLLLPVELWGRLAEDQRQTLVAHELAHLARRDHWVRGLELLATGLYWWNPVVWWARHGLREAEERCCDAWVVWALPAAARAYATALVETVDFLSEARPVLPPAASGVGHVRILKRRLTMILQGKTPRALSAAGFLGLAAFAALMLPLLPTWAQEPPALPKPPQPVPPNFQLKVVEETPADPAAVDKALKWLILHQKAEQAPGEGKGDLDQAINALRKKLAELEAQRAGQPKGKAGADPKKAAEIEQARAEVMMAEVRLHAARAKLAALEGSNRIWIEIKDGKKIAVPNVFYKIRQPERKDLPGKGEGKPGGNEERLQRLEKQLGELLREVRELRGEKKPGSR